VIWTALLLFVLALVLRILFLLTIPDAAGPYNPYYIGDTPTWLEYAKAIQSGSPFDLGLPLRPPGVAYLIALVWSGQEAGLPLLKLAWSVFGAGTVALFFLAVFRSFNYRVAVVAALAAAASTGLIILSTSLNNETPYLLLVIASFTLWEPIRRRPRLRVLLAWSVLHGLACLIRVEHVLFFALVSAYLVWAWVRMPGLALTWKQSTGRGLLMLTLFILPLIPWQLHIWSQINQFNQKPLLTSGVTEQAYQQLESLLGDFPWTEKAVQEKETLPAFCRRPNVNFIAATVAMRGGSEVTAGDFQIIEEAFGSRPGPIGAYPFVAMYGPLNFRLANNSEASGGFTRAPLEAPPPLGGGASGYPAFLVAGLPPPDLAFTYTPHLEIVNHGYRLGLDWILRNPGNYLKLAVRKIEIFWSGVTLGFTGYGLPLGLSGVRGSVDLLAPEGGVGITLWRWAGLAVLLAGLWLGRREEPLVPWMLFLAMKVIATLGFFGYAREGAVLIPVLALMLGLLADRTLPRTGFRHGVQAAFLAAAILLAVEGYRWMSGPQVIVDGQVDGSEYEERLIRVE